jgi:hypothetical protein
VCVEEAPLRIHLTAVSLGWAERAEPVCMCVHSLWEDCDQRREEGSSRWGNSILHP